MDDTPLLILAFFLVGIPGATWLWLQFRTAQKREQTAYDWSMAEIARRTKLLDEKEREYVDVRGTIGKLLNEVTRLETEKNRLETMIGDLRVGQDNERAELLRA